MPPKTKKAGKSSKKISPNKDGGKPVETSGKIDRVLRKNPKKKTFNDESHQTEPKTKGANPKGQRDTKKRNKPAEKPGVSDDVQLTLRESEDDFSEASEPENVSTNATPEVDSTLENMNEVSGDENSRGAGPAMDLAGEVNKHVDAALDKYFRKKHKSKRSKKKKRRRREQQSSSSESDSSYVSSDEEETSSSDSYSSESSEDRKKTRKRKKKEKAKHKRSHKGKSNSPVYPLRTESESTIYTRGCKSPQNAMMEGSTDESLDGAGIDSDANTEEFISSLNTSRDRSTPNLDKSRGRSRSPKRGDNSRERTGRDADRDRYDEQYRDRADGVIRDLHQNKADLAKPSGELSQFLLSSLVRDFKHFHLTSHVDKKIKERIQAQDFTVDFRRLLPKSRAKSHYDDRLHVVHQEGSTFFVPAGDREVKEINGYKTWEVAFKIFMGIFNQFWPDRMHELLQYSHVIQTASLGHPWESVFNYDIAFREIMTEQPNTHWGMISQQTWTLQFGENYKGGSLSGINPGGSTTAKAQNQNRKPCWRFNKGRCTFGDQCEYDHRCSHCGKRGHGRHECFKRAKGEKGVEVKKERTSKK